MNDVLDLLHDSDKIFFANLCNFVYFEHSCDPLKILSLCLADTFYP